MLMGDDSDSASGLDDSETSRSGLDSSFGRFPVVNDDERYALMDTESTRGTRKQTRWGKCQESKYKIQHNLTAQIYIEPVEDIFRYEINFLYMTSTYKGYNIPVDSLL
jgi:hypothetical protein